MTDHGRQPSGGIADRLREPDVERQPGRARRGRHADFERFRQCQRGALVSHADPNMKNEDPQPFMDGRHGMDKSFLLFGLNVYFLEFRKLNVVRLLVEVKSHEGIRLVNLHRIVHDRQDRARQDPVARADDAGFRLGQAAVEVEEFALELADFFCDAASGRHEFFQQFLLFNRQGAVFFLELVERLDALLDRLEIFPVEVHLLFDFPHPAADGGIVSDFDDGLGGDVRADGARLDAAAGPGDPADDDAAFALAKHDVVPRGETGVEDGLGHQDVAFGEEIGVLDELGRDVPRSADVGVGRADDALLDDDVSAGLDKSARDRLDKDVAGGPDHKALLNGAVDDDGAVKVDVADLVVDGALVLEDVVDPYGFAGDDDVSAGDGEKFGAVRRHLHVLAGLQRHVLAGLGPALASVDVHADRAFGGRIFLDEELALLHALDGRHGPVIDAARVVLLEFLPLALAALEEKFQARILPVHGRGTLGDQEGVVKRAAPPGGGGGGPGGGVGGRVP